MRQHGPHAHSVTLDPANRFAFVADLGPDELTVYRFDPTRGVLEPNSAPWIKVKPGVGPRHMAFHSNGKRAYLINEPGSTLTALACGGRRGALNERQVVPTLPEEFRGQSTRADVQVAPSGQFVYGSNRGHNSIVIYRVHPRTGRLTCIGHEPTQGQTSCSVGIDPTGRFLLAANQDSDTIVTFRIHPRTGALQPTGQVAPVPTPVCVKFLLRKTR